MQTFRQIWETKDQHQVLQQLDAANREYIDSGYSGNYLHDFLSAHGDEKASPIEFHPGDPWQSGPGIKFKN